MSTQRLIPVLPVIVLAQFCCTSLWFASNAVLPDMIETFQLPVSALGGLTSAVQLGFISGTLLFAIFTIADRFSPSKVFWWCAIAGAIANAACTWSGNSYTTLLSWRVLTGCCLAGIYPVGMKIAADYFDRSLGRSLGFLVGALVLGTAFPHALRALGGDWPWRYVLWATSALATAGSLLLVLTVPDGPYRHPGQGFDPGALLRVFRNTEFRRAAFGYFGHMWELYAFWAFVPVAIDLYQQLHPGTSIAVASWSFAIIAVGGPACVIGGMFAERFGTRRTARTLLALSGLCCLLSAWFFAQSSLLLFLAFLLFWGMVVVADSPLFSTLVARNAPPTAKGTALTIVNAIGFAITIISIQLLDYWQDWVAVGLLYTILALGPVLGVAALRR